MKKEAYKEIGKSSLNIAVAWVIFGIIQPVFAGKFSIVNGVIASLAFIAFLSVGIILLNRGGSDE